MDPVSSFVRSMSATSQMMRGANQDKRADQVHGMRMDAYDRQVRSEDETEERRGNVRRATGKLQRLQNDGVTGADVASSDPDAGFTLAEFDRVFDANAQNEAMGQVMPLVQKVASGQPLAQEEMEPIRATAGALTYTGVLPKTVPEIRQQVGAAKGLQAAIVQLSGKAGKPLLGRKTKIDSTTNPELFEMFSQTFPAIKGGSKGFNGDFTPVEFYVDGTGSEDIRDARVIVIGEGVDAQGKAYRAPMSTRRSSDPDDEVMATPLKEVYGRANYAERMANSFIATIIENDDGAAQDSLDRYYKLSDQVAQEKKKREQNTQLGDALGDVVGFSDQEKQSMAKLVAAGGNPKDAADIVISARPKVKKGSITWRDNVDIGGKPYQVAFDGSGQQVARVPQYVKDSGSGGSGGGSGRGGAKVDKGTWDRFMQHFDRQFIAEVEALQPQGGDANADVLYEEAVTSGSRERFMDDLLAKASPELRSRYNQGLQQGEHFITDGGFAPVLAANKSYEYANQRPASSGGEAASPSVFAKASIDQVMTALGKIPDVSTRLNEVQRYLASDAPQEVKEKVRYQYESQLAKGGAGMARGKREKKYDKDWQTRETPSSVMQTMAANVHNAAPDYSAYDIPGVASGMRGLDQVANYFFIDPTKHAGSSLSGLLTDFQAWARAGGFNSQRQAVEAYTKENPEQAKQIVAASVSKG